jgi:MFS transporter, DHA3 family, macrolide efflux protein
MTIDMSTQPNRDFHRFLIVWAGQMVSAIGTGLSAFTLGVYAFRTTGLATSYALIVLFGVLPSFLLKPIGGVLADHFDRRLLIVISDLGGAAGLVFILFIMSAGHIRLWQIDLGVAMTSVFAALRDPAYKASISDFLSPDDYAKASGLVHLAGSAQFLVSPLIAGILIGFFDIKYILTIDIGTYALAIVTVMVVRRKMVAFMAKPMEGRFIDELREGFQATVANKGIRWLIGITALVLFYIGLLQALFAPMVLEFTDVRKLGISQSVCAIGMLVSSLLIGVAGGKSNFVAILAGSLGLMGLFFSFLGLSTNIFLLIIPGFFFFFVIPFVNSSIDVLIRNNIDNSQQGRVWSFVSVITYSGAVLSYFVAGFLADHVFNPLFLPHGIFADSILGRLVGIGPGRGIAFMFVMSGLAVVTLAFFVFRSKEIKGLESQTV